MKVFLIILLLIFIAGLAVFVAMSVPLPAEADTTRATKIGRELYEYRLEDGTRCIIWDGNRAGGIACDWRKP